MRMIDFPDPRLPIIRTPSLEPLGVELIDLFMALRSESEVHGRIGLVALLVDPEVIVHAVCSVAYQLIRHEVFSLVPEGRKGGVVEGEDCGEG